jgi:hypothetical protein
MSPSGKAPSDPWRFGKDRRPSLWKEYGPNSTKLFDEAPSKVELCICIAGVHDAQGVLVGVRLQFGMASGFRVENPRPASIGIRGP